MSPSGRRPARPRLVVSATLMALTAGMSAGCSTASVDATSKASLAMADPGQGRSPASATVLIILASAPDGSTARIGRAIAGELDAALVSPQEAGALDLARYRIIGFGSGIFDQGHHKSVLDAAERLPLAPGQKVFLFSTSGVSRDFATRHGIDDPHTPLRERLQARGCEVSGEYNCAGFNDNSFLKLFGGMNKGRPSEKDLGEARAFALSLRAVTGED